MAMNKKIQFYFPESLFLEMNIAAKRQKISMAEFVRKAVEKYLKDYREEDQWDKDPLNKMIGFFEGEKDLSETIDLHLYGIKK